MYKIILVILIGHLSSAVQKIKLMKITVFHRYELINEYITPWLDEILHKSILLDVSCVCKPIIIPSSK